VNNINLSFKRSLDPATLIQYLSILILKTLNNVIWESLAQRMNSTTRGCFLQVNLFTFGLPMKY